MLRSPHVCGGHPQPGSPPAILLRESYREAGKTENRTVANLSRWPAERIDQLRAVLRGDQLLPAGEAVEIVRALPHGHVLAALGTARRIALDAVLPRRAPQRRRDLALALIVARLLEPAAKMATAREALPEPEPPSDAMRPSKQKRRSQCCVDPRAQRSMRSRTPSGGRAIPCEGSSREPSKRSWGLRLLQRTKSAAGSTALPSRRIKPALHAASARQHFGEPSSILGRGGDRNAIADHN
jgi:hypothetical protein